MTRVKKVSGRSLLGWRLKTPQALSICNKSLPTDKPISCYLWKRNIYSEAVRSNDSGVAVGDGRGANASGVGDDDDGDPDQRVVASSPAANQNPPTNVAPGQFVSGWWASWERSKAIGEHSSLIF